MTETIAIIGIIFTALTFLALMIAPWVKINIAQGKNEEQFKNINKDLAKFDAFPRDFATMKATLDFLKESLIPIPKELRELSNGILNLGSEVVTHVKLSDERMENLKSKIAKSDREVKENMDKLNLYIEELKKSNENGKA